MVMINMDVMYTLNQNVKLAILNCRANLISSGLEILHVLRVF